MLYGWKFLNANFSVTHFENIASKMIVHVEILNLSSAKTFVTWTIQFLGIVTY